MTSTDLRTLLCCLGILSLFDCLSADTAVPCVSLRRSYRANDELLKNMKEV